jgi:F-type H+-transporting ATPase subunit b
MAALLDPHAAEFWVLLAFILFIWMLVYYKVPGMIGEALDARAEAIRRELDEARRLREQAQELLADYQKRARDAETEAKEIVDSAKREAEAIGAESRRTLQESIERRTRLAEDKIARAEAQAIAEVRAAAIDKAVAAAETVLKGRVGGEVGAGLIEQGIRDLKSKLN